MRKTYYLCMGTDSLDAAKRHVTLGAAKATFYETAQELASYGQAISATVHIASSREWIDEYPDYVLSIGPRGGLRCDKC